MTSLKDAGRVEFRFFRPQAREVVIAGTFNGWSQRTHRMLFIGQGWWRAEIEVPTGEHQFRYVADGEWYTDFAANGIEVTRQGVNSILIVPDSKTQPIRLAA